MRSAENRDEEKPHGWVIGVQKHRARSRAPAAFVLMLMLGFGIRTPFVYGATANEPQDSTSSRRTARVPLIRKDDVRFITLSSNGLSQTRAAEMAQDNQGFIWFGTQYGLNRYDGYNFKVFLPNPSRLNSLGGSYVYALFNDRDGMLWIGCDEFLDRLDPSTETFTHYHIGGDISNVPATVVHISQDRSGALWLSTGKGLYRFDPKTGQTTHHYTHETEDPDSLGSNDVRQTGEDRSGRFWVAAGNNLEELDRQSGRIKRRIRVGNSALRSIFYEDSFGILWLGLFETEGTGRVAALDPNTNEVIEYSFYEKDSGKTVRLGGYTFLEDNNKALWIATYGNGLLKLDRQNQVANYYRNDPNDPKSLPDDRVISLLNDREGNVWAGLQGRTPAFFSTRQASFTSVLPQTFGRFNLGEQLVGAIFEDRKKDLWIGGAGHLTQLSRHTGRYKIYRPFESADDVASIIEDARGLIWFGTWGRGLWRLDQTTALFKHYRHNPADASSLSDDVVLRLFFDRSGTMWLATWNGLARYDPHSDGFVTFKRDKKTSWEPYLDISQEQNGILWLGSGSGLQRFDPVNGQFTGFQHKLDDPKSLSDSRVTSVHVDRFGQVWAATHNGLGILDQRNGTFKTYYEKDGLPSNRVNCILEGQDGDLWVSTNRGLSRFQQTSKSFKNYSVADGLPGMDMTGYVSCYRGSSGEMFFAGFAGATAFQPDAVSDNAYIPSVVFTDFRLFGRAVDIGNSSPLKRAIGYADNISLTSAQNTFSLKFAALSHSRSEMVRYRYKLDGLDHEWNDSPSDERIVNYAGLPPGAYVFHVQAATGQSGWGTPGAVLNIEILPPWWKTWWFRIAVLATVLASFWQFYRMRVHQLRHQERKLRNVIETIPTFAWSALPDGSLDFANHHWERFTGFPIEKTVGARWQEAVHPDDFMLHTDKWQRSIKSGEPFENEVRFRGREGQYRWFLVRAVPLRDTRGKIVKWYGTSTDIEDRKRAEELQAELAHVNRVSMLGEMAASLAHEIKQPIAAAITSANSCIQWLSHEPPNVVRARAAASRVDEYGNRATEIINRIRSLYKNSPPNRELVEVNRIVEEILTLLQSEATRRSVTMRTELADGVPKIKVDRVQMQQVFMNLILNGIEAMQESGGELRVRSQLQDVQLLFSVSDTGIGLPSERVEQIFAAFFTTKPQGSGMGLTISRSIVESHGGRLWATTNDGKGTTFHFTVPLHFTEPLSLVN